jgi:hypothetical protein
MEMMKKEDKDPNAVALGSKGGKARRNKLTPEQRKEIASKAAKTRWSKQRSHNQKPS